MKKIKDERLIVQNLKNIRLLFAFQTTGIVLILIYERLQNGFEGLSDSPLRLLLVLTGTLGAFLSMPISAEVYDSQPMKYRTIMLISLVAGILTGGINYWTGQTLAQAFGAFSLSSGSFFVSLWITKIIIAKQRMK